jgi:DNA-binding LacI/PurR family transcriptional regulator
MNREIRQFRKATIRQVAEKAGVSSTTVSLFMNGRESVCSRETAERIRGAISVLNYTPNSLTRGLRKGELITIGVCMQNPAGDDYVFGSLYLEQLWRGVMQQADRESYSLLRYPEALIEKGAWEPFLDGRVDGMILHDHENERAEHLSRVGMPTTLIDRRTNVPEGCGAVYADQTGTVGLALRHLWQLGHRRIAHVAGPVGERAGDVPTPNVPGTFAWPDVVAVDRLDSYCEWMKRHGAFDPDLIGYAQAWSAPQAYQMLRRWLAMDKPPTAVFCANDAQAADIIGAAVPLGLSVPQALSVVGVDDSPIATSNMPQITSVKVPMIQVGQEAVRVLLRMFGGAPIQECRIAVPVTHISIRQSTAPLIRG